MGRPDITNVIRVLQEAGFRAGRAYPGQRMPRLQQPAVAVALQKDETDFQVLAVTVLCPENLGGGQCENIALEVTDELREMGYSCVQEHCQFDGKGDRFAVRILATWQDELEEFPYAVALGYGPMNYVKGFSSVWKRSVQALGTFGQTVPVGFALGPEYWTFTIEEHFPEGEEPGEPAEPFEMVVRRGNLGEIYGGCCWTSVSRVNTRDGLQVVRQGTAQTRRVHQYG